LLEEGNTDGFIHGMKIFSKLISIMNTWLKESDEEEDDEGESRAVKIPKPEVTAEMNKLPHIVQEVTKHISKFATWLTNPPSSY